MNENIINTHQKIENQQQKLSIEEAGIAPSINELNYKLKSELLEKGLIVYEVRNGNSLIFLMVSAVIPSGSLLP